MNELFRVCFAAECLAFIGNAAFAAEEINNGTNPTLLTTTAGIQYKHSDLRNGATSGLFEAFYAQPFGANKQYSLQLTLPYASGAIDKDFGLGDIGLKFTHILDVNPKTGLAYSTELLFNSAQRAELGSGQTVLKASGFYAFFLESGIFVPSLVQQVGLGDEDAGRVKVNNTTLDFYYVPKLPDPKYFITFDPALVYDWQRDVGYGSLTVTFGRSLGKLFGGNAVAFVKPQILAGEYRPADWTVQVGFKVIGF